MNANQRVSPFPFPLLPTPFRPAVPEITPASGMKHGESSAVASVPLARLEVIGQAPEVKRRIFVRFTPANIPGEAAVRHATLAEAFCQQVFGRAYQYPLRDWVYVQQNRDKEDEKCWMILDLNVGTDGLDTNMIPFICVLGKYVDDTAYVCPATDGR